MPAASYRVLSGFFTTHLNFTPTQADIDQFERDLAVVSPSLMRDSLIELSQGRSAKPAGQGQWRGAIYAIYNRKVAEHAQLFPVFHCFETAFRSRIAVTLEDHYSTPRWWSAMATAHRSGQDFRATTRIGVIDPVPSDRRRAIFLLADDLTRAGVDVMAFDDGYELLEKSTLGQTKRLLETHWPLFRGFFVSPTGQQMKPEVVIAKFEKVRAARNNVYHHLPFAGMTDIYDTADELLTCLAFKLPKVHRAIADTEPAPPRYF